MKQLRWVFIILIMVMLNIGAVSFSADVTTVPYVDLQKYLGHWYEIASIPAWFQKPCVGGTTASYRLLDDGSISVVNSCLTDSDNVLTLQGRAFVEDTQTNAKLLVSFVNLNDTWLFPGNYWVLGLGNYYEYAVVGEPTREYGWILSRRCTLSSENLAEIIDILTAQGYDISQFILTNQSSFGCTPE